ncbi:hypothetical protein OSH11_14445 [Kaistia dalseonensis]|uniref:Uncharacterized protein n=1 Tax=Kaistia dalseonensis TaxID=410840 RepID=A0ABU0H878_9HYPH|nr:hypothetical protein [Kaistia dalseonensis]MCX5495909.1 hypothetical protein [Kaistia dalseonensis]MDQ0438512.1 hypothetical protein [Kaistia dalseonensis]
MFLGTRSTHRGHALLALAGIGMMMVGTGSAEAVVYCKTAGVPQGCVVRPAPVVVAPVVRAPVVVTPRVGVGSVGVGAPGVGVAPGYVGNRGGPVNRVGRY